MQVIRLSQLMSLTTSGERPASRAQESMLAILALGAALVLASIWGIAAGSESAQLSLANAYKVPMVILLSALTALPATNSTRPSASRTPCSEAVWPRR